MLNCLFVCLLLLLQRQVGSFTAPDLLNHLITSEQYSNDQDVMMQIVDVLAAVVKEEIEALKQCGGNVPFFFSSL